MSSLAASSEGEENWGATGPVGTIRPVPGAPVSARQVEERRQICADGAATTNVLTSQVCRDSAGRVRIEWRAGDSSGRSAEIVYLLGAHGNTPESQSWRAGCSALRCSSWLHRSGAVMYLSNIDPGVRQERGRVAWRFRRGRKRGPLVSPAPCMYSAIAWAGMPERAPLLPRPAFRILQLRLPHFDFLPLGLADDESAAAEVFGFIQFVVRQKLSPVDV